MSTTICIMSQKFRMCVRRLRQFKLRHIYCPTSDPGLTSVRKLIRKYGGYGGLIAVKDIIGHQKCTNACLKLLIDHKTTRRWTVYSLPVRFLRYRCCSHASRQTPGVELRENQCKWYGCLRMLMFSVASVLSCSKFLTQTHRYRGHTHFRYDNKNKELKLTKRLFSKLFNQ